MRGRSILQLPLVALGFMGSHGSNPCDRLVSRFNSVYVHVARRSEEPWVYVWSSFNAVDRLICPRAEVFPRPAANAADAKAPPEIGVALADARAALASYGVTIPEAERMIAEVDPRGGGNLED